MKNRINYILLCLIVSFAFINNVFADTAVTLVTDNTTVVNGSEVSVRVNLRSDEVVTACLIKVTSDDSIEFVEKNNMNSWNVTQEGGVDGFTIENSAIVGDILTGGQNILEFKYKINGAGEIKVHTDHCSNGANNTGITDISEHSISFTTKEKEDDTSLSDLSITGGEPISFDSTKLSYASKLNSSTFGLNITTSNPDYQDDVVVKDEDGNIINDIKNIIFSDPSGQSLMTLYIIIKDTTTYTLMLNYENVELDNSLSSVTINGVSLTLEPGKTDYTFEVDSDVTSVLIKVTLKDSEHFKISNNSNVDKEINISGDTCSASIIVEPKDDSLGGTENAYMITIKRKSNNSNDGSGTGNNDKEPTDNNKKPTGGNEPVKNPQTSDISMFVMALVLISSLVSSLILYKKNLESYR